MPLGLICHGEREAVLKVSDVLPDSGEDAGSNSRLVAVGGGHGAARVTSTSSPSSQGPCHRACHTAGPQLSHAGLSAEDPEPTGPTPGLPEQEPGAAQV
ncbi:hypothetical protein PAL_GLEAN10002715 [Pteropus alecto]|uniref:Uncharacterized protein n=1 Tax=Pteropus alecto TaxID=9402 RepID=L5JX64_PTEAL|nr:hypothetical protein PAL_GLEAN10002715 [Pteropus alecto]